MTLPRGRFDLFSNYMKHVFVFFGALLFFLFCHLHILVRASDKRIACEEEFSDSEDEGEGGRRNVADHKKGTKKARLEEDKKENDDKKSG